MRKVRNCLKRLGTVKSSQNNMQNNIYCKNIKTISLSFQIQQEQNDQQKQQINCTQTDSEPKDFNQLDLIPFIIENLQKMNITSMTKVQQKAIPLVLAGNDIAVKAKTGSGKTIAFLAPAIDLIYRSQMKQRNGTGVIIISPTRELALQTCTVARQLLADKPSIQIGLSVGGTSLQKETERLALGCQLVIATPGRLVDHLKNSVGFKTNNLFMIILDEADQLLNLGFEEEISQILNTLPNKETRQICLFSATLNDRVMNMKSLNLKQNLVKIDADEIQADSEQGKNLYTLREEFQQGFIFVQPDMKFLLLYTILKKQHKHKIIVFMASCAEVEFYSTFLRYINFENVFSLHGKLKQTQRNLQIQEFAKQTCGVLLCTNVAARGLDITDIDYVIQYDAPGDIESYVHRCGRACRGKQGKQAQGILFLAEHERKFINLVNTEVGCQIKEYEFPLKQIINIQSQFEKIINSNYNFLVAAQDAFRDCCAAYANQTYKEVFDIRKLNLQQLGKSFGLKQIPRVDSVQNLQRQAWKKQAKKNVKHE